MDYATFKTYLATFLWRPNDSDLLANLDSLVSMGEAYLNRELKALERDSAQSYTLDTALDVALPSDYYSITEVSGTSDRYGEFTYISPGKMHALRSTTLNNSWRTSYSISGSNLMFCGPISGPIDVIIEYQSVVPDFKTADTSWVADKMLDILTYATLVHTSMFLREDTRLPNWQNLLTALIEKENERYEWNKRRGKSEPMPLSRVAGVSRKSGSITGKLTY